ncbi:MAG: 5-(carboxyamino)imidazole ribonucleotide synthase [Pseudomonadota bacterium]
MLDPLASGATIGILGGGQLGRMLAMAASKLGFRPVIYTPPGDTPAVDVTTQSVIGAYDEWAALERFVGLVDRVTLEFENIPTATIDWLAERVPVAPDAYALRIAQDRSDEKNFLNAHGIATASFAEVSSMPDFDAVWFEPPWILKTRRLGYDGKGQARIAARDPELLETAWHGVGAVPSVVEGLVPFLREISVIVARGADGTVRCYDPGENVHETGILRRTTVPAAINSETATAARAIAERIVTALDYIGVMGVEMFETTEGLIVNEIAPRVHNTGHWTLEACAVSQFEQQIRAVASWPLGDPVRHADAVMENLIGEEIGRVAAIPEPGVSYHSYGKASARPGRKMGHVTRLSPMTEPTR